MATAYLARSFAGGAQATTLASPMLNTDTSFTLVTATGWPSGASGNFWVDIDPGLPSEEKILCSATTGVIVTCVGRGGGSGDGTVAAAHNAGAVVRIVHVSQDDSEANALVANLGNLAVGSIPTGGGTATLPSSIAAVAAGALLTSQGTVTKPAWLAAGASGSILLGGTTPSWLAVGAAGTVLGGGTSPTYSVLPGTLLATQNYVTGHAYTTSTGAVAALDATNLTLAFTVPASGNVDIVVQFMNAELAITGTSSILFIQPMNHSGGGALGTAYDACVNSSANTTAVNPLYLRFHLTGLAAGAYQVDIGAGMSVSGAGSVGTINSPCLIQAFAA